MAFAVASRANDVIIWSYLAIIGAVGIGTEVHAGIHLFLAAHCEGTPGSIVLGGNIDTDLERREPSPHYRHYFEILSPELQDAAFLDRIHAFLPGWEMPKVRPENYATGYGFITDYLAEIFTRLRRHNYQTHVAAHVDFGRMTGRNQDAVKKTTAGLLKLVFPHRAAEDLGQEKLKACLTLAIECLQRVLDQLAVMLPEEFGRVRVEVGMRTSSV